MRFDPTSLIPLGTLARGDIRLPREDIRLPKQTILSPEAEALFQAWYADAAHKLQINPNPDDPAHHYDYRQAFQKGVRVPPNPPAGWHFPSDAGKADDHPNAVVGGFDTRTGQRVPGTPRAKSVQGLIDQGWSPASAVRLMRTPEPK